MARSTWGSIRAKTKGVWELRYNDGKSRRSKIIRGTKKEAERELANLRIQYEGIGPATTLDQFWHKSYHNELKMTVSIKTLDGYEGYYRRNVCPAFGDTPIQDITAKDIQEWLYTMTYVVAKHSKAVLSAMLTSAITEGLIDNNVALNRFKYPKKSTSKTTNKSIYTKQELDAIAEACQGEVFESGFLWGAFAGGLRSEVLGIKTEEVMEIDGYACAPVKRGIHRAKGATVIEEHGKNQYRETYLIIAPPHAERALELVKQAASAGDIWLTDDGFGNPMDPEAFRRSWDRWFKTHPFIHVPFQNLRPSYATYMRTEGYADDIVVGELRHAGTEMMTTVYDRPDIADLVKRIIGLRRNPQS